MACASAEAVFQARFQGLDRDNFPHGPFQELLFPNGLNAAAARHPIPPHRTAQQFQGGFVDCHHSPLQVGGNYAIGQAAQDVFLVLLFREYAVKETGVFQGNAGLGVEGPHEGFIGSGEVALFAVEQLTHANQLPRGVKDRQAEGIASVQAMGAIEQGIKIFVGGGMAQVQGLSLAHHMAHQTPIARHLQRSPVFKGGAQPARVPIEPVQRAIFRLHKVAGFRHHRLQNPIQFQARLGK